MGLDILKTVIFPIVLVISIPFILIFSFFRQGKYMENFNYYYKKLLDIFFKE